MKTGGGSGFALPTLHANRNRFEKYLSDSLGVSAHVAHVTQIRGGCRNRLWRLDIAGAGQITTVVLRTARASSESLADEVYPHSIPLEFETYRALRRIGLPVPEVWGLDSAGSWLGIPCFLMEFIEGASLKDLFRDDPHRAEGLFLEAVCMLQDVTRDELGIVSGNFAEGNTAQKNLDWIAESLPKYTSDSLVDKVYERLSASCPTLDTRFGNGDLTPVNMLVRDGRIAGLIDFEFAGFFDPIWEFLAPFGWSPELRDRGLEKRYCERNGFDAGILEWYRPAVLFGWWLGALSEGDSGYPGYAADRSRKELPKWIEGR